MLKWLITIIVVLILFSGLQKSLSRLGWGRLPGDFSFTVRGREFNVPLASTILLSCMFAALSYFI